MLGLVWVAATRVIYVAALSHPLQRRLYPELHTRISSIYRNLNMLHIFSHILLAYVLFLGVIAQGDLSAGMECDLDASCRSGLCNDPGSNGYKTCAMKESPEGEACSPSFEYEDCAR